MQITMIKQSGFVFESAVVLCLFSQLDDLVVEGVNEVLGHTYFQILLLQDLNEMFGDLPSVLTGFFNAGGRLVVGVYELLQLSDNDYGLLQVVLRWMWWLLRWMTYSSSW